MKFVLPQHQLMLPGEAHHWRHGDRDHQASHQRFGSRAGTRTPSHRKPKRQQQKRRIFHRGFPG